MNKPIISIIVPVYKVEKYLADCIDSITAQTFEDIEIILVDDGSPDNCGQLCDDYAKTDKRIKVIHKQNGGLSDARNAGIQAASGRYLGFIDSDDYIAPDMFERLYNSIIETDSDISMCRAANFNDGSIAELDKGKGETFIFEGSDIIKALFTGKINNFAWNKLYKKELFDEIRFPYGKIYEDLFTTYRLCGRSKRLVLIDERKYAYRIRDNSIMGKARRIIHTDKFLAFAEIYDFLSNDDTVRDMAVEYMYRDLVSDVFKIVAADEIKNNEKFFDALKGFLKTIKTKDKKKLFFLKIAVYAPGVIRLRYKLQKVLRRL